MIPKMVKRQRDFSAGQIDENAHRRDDRPEFKFGIRRGRNIVSTNVGSLKRRAGRKYLYAGAGVRDQFRPYSGFDFQIAFDAGQFRARDGKAVVSTLVAPWTADMVPKLRWGYSQQYIIVCGPSPMRPQVIMFDRATLLWSITDFAFDLSVNNTVRAPFFRFESNGFTMRPTARTGTVNLTTSGATFVSGHVGVGFRYVKKQLRILTVTSPTTATALILEELPPTYQILLNSTQGFSVGEIVEATVSGFKGEIISVDDATHLTVVAMKNWYELAAADKLVGPVSSATVTSKAEVSPGATSQWDEQFMSDVRGWPQSVSVDVQRVIYCNFPQAKNFILWSAVSAPFDCYLAADSTAAILEYIPRELQIFHVIGGYDEFALTDSGSFYIPISGGTPLSPGSVEFRQISSGAVADVTPIAVTEGVIFVDASLNRLSAITATGQTARPYQVNDITRYHTELFNGIVALAASTSDPSISGRQMYVINGDGTYCIGRYEDSHDYVGWFLQDGAGLVTHVQARYDQIIFSVNYNGFNVAETIDVSALMDCEVTLLSPDGADYLQLVNEEPLELSTGAVLALDGYQMANFANLTMQVRADGFYLGDVNIAANGAVAVTGTYAKTILGFKSNIALEPNLEDFEGGESFNQRLRKRKVSKVVVRMKDTTQFSIGPRQYSTYRQGDNMDIPLAARTDTYEYRQAGRSWDPNYQIGQIIPGTFECLELTTEMTI